MFVDTYCASSMVSTGNLKINVFSTPRSSVKKEINKNLQLGYICIIEECTRPRGISVEYERIWHADKNQLIQDGSRKNVRKMVEVRIGQTS